MTRRSQAADETRLRVVDAARRLFAQRGFHGVSLEEVARTAGVGRKTIYNQFGSKVGLFDALVSAVSESVGISEFVAAALAEREASAALRRFIDGCCEVWAAEHDVIEALIAHSHGDAEARTVVDRANRARREDLGRLVELCGLINGSPPPAGIEATADLLSVLTSFESFDHLRRMGHTNAEASQLLSLAAWRLFETGENPC